MDEIQRESDGTFAVGHRKRGGRQPGTVNRFTALREEILDSYYTGGGAEKLLQLMEESPRDYFKLLVSVLPRLKVEQSRSLSVDVDVRDMSMEELQSRLQSVETEIAELEQGDEGAKQ